MADIEGLKVSVRQGNEAMGAAAEHENALREAVADLGAYEMIDDLKVFTERVEGLLSSLGMVATASGHARSARTSADRAVAAYATAFGGESDNPVHDGLLTGARAVSEEADLQYSQVGEMRGSAETALLGLHAALRALDGFNKMRHRTRMDAADTQRKAAETRDEGITYVQEL